MSDALLPVPRSKMTALEKAQQNKRIMEFLAAGLSVQQVADQLGISSKAVYKVRNRELEKLAQDTTEHAEQLRHLDLTRVENAIRAIYPKVLKADLPAIDRLDKLITQRQKLLGVKDDGGLDAPTFVFNIDTARIKELENATFRDSIDGTALELPDDRAA